MYDLRTIARALGGEVSGQQVLAPGPNHSRTDRSMSVRISSGAPDGFVTYSHAGDDWRICRDHVRERLGIERASPVLENIRVQPKVAAKPNMSDDERIVDAVALFKASVDPRGTAAEAYFMSRRLEIADLAGRVIRWNQRIGAAIALFRNFATGEPQAVSRIFLDSGGRKINRKFMGPVGGAGIMLDAFDAVTAGLHLAEGVETAQAARQLGLKPTWALGSAGAIAAFPVLTGVECLTLLAERDDASARAVEACGTRWTGAGKEVLVTRSFNGKDINDALMGAA